MSYTIGSNVPEPALTLSDKITIAGTFATVIGIWASLRSAKAAKKRRTA